MTKTVEIATITVTSSGAIIKTANGQEFVATVGDEVRLNYEFEQDFIDVLEELQKRSSA